LRDLKSELEQFAVNGDDDVSGYAYSYPTYSSLNYVWLGAGTTVGIMVTGMTTATLAARAMWLGPRFLETCRFWQAWRRGPSLTIQRSGNNNLN